jgi:hypothetical protein
MSSGALHHANREFIAIDIFAVPLTCRSVKWDLTQFGYNKKK